jgi:hypothetical protein
VAAIAGVTFLDDPQEIVIATVTAPMREIEPEPTEEELAEAEAAAEAGEEGAPEGAAEGGEAGEAEGEPGTDEG